MPQFISPHQKKQKKLLIGLGIVVLAIILVLYFGLKRPSPGPPLSGAPEMPEIPLSGEPPAVTELPTVEVPQPVVQLLTKIKLDLDFLKSEKFLSLKTFGQIPVKVEEKGRANPFLPY